MTQSNPMQDAYTHILHSYNPLEIKDILLHGAARKATKHKPEDDVLDQSVLTMTNEQTLAAAVLNRELSEYTTKTTVYTPHGDVIMFK